jgi:hypothetical protein
MNKSLKVSRGKDLLTVSLSGHSYVRLLDEDGAEAFRADSPTRHVNARVKPGRYVIETDGKIQKAALTAVEARHRDTRETDASKPPRSKSAR